MSSLFIAFIMGFVEGMTEFLPVSSTGHLIIASHLLNFEGASAENFEVIIQVGAIFAVIWLYFARFWGLLFPKKDEITQKIPKLSGFYGLFLLFLTCLPASLLGLLFHSHIKSLFSIETVLFSLVFGAFCMLIVEKIDKKEEITTVDELTPQIAFKIGCFQILALCPGFSRSASTIMGGMLLGLSRKTAAEYSFLGAVPIIIAAAGYDFLKSYDTFNVEDFSFFIVGIISSFFFALLAIKGFIASLSRLTLKPFAYYRIILAFILYCYFFI